MPETIQVQIDSLRLSIRGLEAQRGVLGEAVLAPALAALREQLTALEAQAAAAALPTEDRRMVTILFMDIVGSTAMAEKLDPEEWRQMVAGVHAALGQAIAAHHGEVAQYLGDGLLAFFGAREAGENDPENAIRAALAGMTAGIQLRAGIHSGLVVVGELGAADHREFTASGDAVNLAARLQSAAPPGGILISHETYRYVRGVFDLTPRPPLTVKGKSEPLHTYLVRRAKPRPFRSVARGVAGVETRTVGREAEVQCLEQAYLHAFEGHGVAWAQLIGDPGVGKSRLLVDLTEWIDLREETTRLLRARAFPDDGGQPFALVRRMWFDRFQIAEDAPLPLAEARWVQRYKEFSGQADSDEPAHALGLLVGLPFLDSPFIKAMREHPTQVKGRALVVSRELLRAVRRQAPVVVLLEDLQWTDAASWEYLVELFLGEAEEGLPNGVFVLGAARPEWRPPAELAALLDAASPTKAAGETWGMRIDLQPLTTQAMAILVAELFQRAEAIPAEIVELVVQRAEGVPYYAEEIVNWFIDHSILDTSGERWRFLPEKLKEQPLPATLQHLLLTRLGSLSGAERAALQRGSIFGRRFWSGGVAALGVLDGEQMLGHLQPRGFVEAQPESAFEGDTEWCFHHNLLQEVTYESVLKRERQALHKVAAGWLESQARQAGRLDEFAGLLGDHCRRAGELSTAADWYQRAGRRAYAQGAPREAVDFYSAALELLPPVDRERRWLGLLGREEAYGVLSEMDACRVDIAALLELAEAAGDDSLLAEAYLRQSIYAMRTADEELAMQASQQTLSAAQRCGDEAVQAKALALLSVAASNQNDKSSSLAYVTAAEELARRLDDAAILSFVVQRAAYSTGHFGDLARSEQLRREQIELDRQLGDRSQEAIGLTNLAADYVTMGLYKQGRVVIQQAMAISEGLGARRLTGYCLMNLAEIYLAVGDLRHARSAAERALHEVTLAQDAKGIYSALGLIGIALLEMGDAPSARRRFQEARELAVEHQQPALISQINIALAASTVRQGLLDEARSFANDGWVYLKKHGWIGMSLPGWVYLTMAETFDALGDEESYREAVEIGHQAVLDVAASINVPEWRQSFLEEVPYHRALLEMWERDRRPTTADSM
jgi:class 3 adenylate cyclase/predicted ATPase